METHYDDTTPASHDTLPPGTYTARCVSAAWDTDRDGNPCIALMFALSDGRPGWQIDGKLYLDESKQDAKGRTALDRSMEALRAMGLQGELTAELVGLDQGDVSLVTDINDKGYARVKFINAPRRERELRVFAPPAAPELNGFLAKINAKSRALQARAQASGAAPIAAPRQSAAATQQAAQATRPVQGTGALHRPPQTGSQRAPQAQQRAPQPAPRMPQTGSQEFGTEDDIPFDVAAVGL